MVYYLSLNRLVKIGLILSIIILLNLNCGEPDRLKQGDYYYNNNELTKAIQTYGQALQNSSDSALVLKKIKHARLKYNALNLFEKGTISYQNSQFESAQNNWKKSLTLFQTIDDSLNLALALQNLGLASFAQYQYQNAIKHFNRALSINQNLNNEEGLADNWGNLGLAYQTQYLFQKALECQMRSLKLNISLKNRKKQAANYENLGSLYYLLGDYLTGLDYFHSALQLENKLNLTLEKVQTWDNLALTQLALGDTNQYLEYAQQAIDVFIQHQPTSNVELALALNNLGQVYRFIRRYADAESISTQALQFFRKMGNLNGQASALCNLGAIHQALGDYRSASQYYQNALKFALDSKDRRAQWICQFNLGQAFELLHESWLALDHYSESIRIIEKMNQSLDSPKMRSYFFINQRDVYDALFCLLKKMGKIEAALETLEHHKSQFYFNRLKSKENVNSERNNPNYFKDFLHEVQTKISAHSAILNYFLTPIRTHIFCITRSNLILIEVEGIEKKIQAEWMTFFRGKTVEHNDRKIKSDDSWKAIMISFYKLLIGSVEATGELQQIQHLIIIPDGLLYYIPLAALIDSNGKYLIESRTLTYGYCLHQLLRPHNPTSYKNYKIALFANPSKETPGMAQEVEKIVELFKGNVRVFIGKNATETALRRIAPEVDILHIAAHGYLYDANPFSSHLDLRSDEKNNGRLELQEIFEMKLKTRLVTLSACKSALGAKLNHHIAEGSDVMGLSTAFIAAGSQNVVASLWNINDHATAQFMIQFYNHLKQKNICDALAIAQRQMLSMEPFRHPYFWAGFILVGSLSDFH